MSERLHLGCGKRDFGPGWTNIDVQDFPHVHLRHAVDNLPMVPTGSADLVYACHILEHFMLAEVPRVLQEWRRILKSGGVLRLSVPNFEALVQIYKLTGRLKNIHGPIMGGQKGTVYDFHYSLWDVKTLHRFLKDAGFKEVRTWDWREVGHGEHDDYSQAYWPPFAKDDPDAILVSINIEATK